MSFDSRAPGTPLIQWDESGFADRAAPLDLTGVRRAVVVAAHPDDETLGAGGLIATLGSAGVEISVVFVTDGSASHPRSPTHSAGRLAVERRREAAEAISLLAPGASVSFLGFADGGTREAGDDIRRAIAALVVGAEVVVAPWHGDGHRDHRVVGEACVSVARASGVRLLEYPIWMWHWATPESDEVSAEAWSSIELSSEAAEAKQSALAHYRSQIEGLGDEEGNGPVLLPHVLEYFQGRRELFVDSAAGSQRMEEQYFDDLYSQRDDPWRLATRWYERRKRAITIASLPRDRYRSALEIGTSIGEVTRMLAARCDRVVSVDISAGAVARAGERLADLDDVVLEHRDATADFPDDTFDLIVLSEVGYYWSRPVLERVIRESEAHLSEDGTLLACHWRHPVDDYLLTGDTVHEIIAETSMLTVVATHVEADFRLDVLARDPRSVAQREGFYE